MGCKPAEEVEVDVLCSHGCNQRAKYVTRSGKYICGAYSTTCPAVRKKNSESVKLIDRDYHSVYADMPSCSKARMAWNKGLTKSDEKMANLASALRGRRRLTDSEKLSKAIYYEQCEFNLAGIIHLVDGYELLVTHMMYDRVKNPDGVVRDHVISVSYGYNHGIDPRIISHPANCRFMSHKDNARKSQRCGMTLDDLKHKIEKWTSDGNWHTLVNESHQIEGSNPSMSTI